MAGKACACGGGEGLNGVSFVKQTLIVQHLNQMPQGFDVVVFVGDIRFLQINPVADFTGQVVPHILKFHYILAALGVVFLHTDFYTDVFLANTQAFFYLQFNGKAVGIPAGFAFHTVSLQGFVAAENILDGAGHHVVNAGHAVGAGRTFKKGERLVGRTVLDAFFKNAVFFPEFEYFGLNGRPVHLFQRWIHILRLRFQ